MKLKSTILLLTLFFLTSCGGATADKQKELELKEKELALKQQELELKEAPAKTEASPEISPSAAADKAAAPAKQNELSNIENLIGYWFKPHEATTNIRFTRDGRFEFNDYNSSKEEEELLTGKYELKDGTLTLMYDDRPKQSFKFYKDGEYYIRKGDYYFVKGDN